jgi:putative sterol carrier protein
VDFILAATPQEWKRLLRKMTKFITVIMLKKVVVEHGDFSGLLKIAPHGDAFVDALTQVTLQFPDEMSPDELAQYKARLKEFRGELGV